MSRLVIQDGVVYSGVQDGGSIGLASGSATITANNSYTTVTHGLGRTPKVTVTPKDQNGLNYYISNVGVSSFRINLQVPQAGDAEFDYMAR